MAQTGTLTPAQRRMIAALLTERDVRTAAKAAGVAERTAWRWLEDATFRAELTRQEAAVIDQVTRGLLAMQGNALKELGDLVSGFGGGVSPAVRLQAIRTVLEIHLKYRELNTIEQRIAALEAAQNVKKLDSTN